MIKLVYKYYIIQSIFPGVCIKFFLLSLCPLKSFQCQLKNWKYFRISYAFLGSGGHGAPGILIWEPQLWKLQLYYCIKQTTAWNVPEMSSHDLKVSLKDSPPHTQS
jgi:hypothetical protein